MKKIAIIVTVLLALSISQASAEELHPDAIFAVVSLNETNIQSEVERLVRLSPHGLSPSNSVAVFKYGPSLRPSLRAIAQSPEEDVSSGAKQWLSCIGDHRDLALTNESNWLRIPARGISDLYLDTVVAKTMDYIVEREKDQLRPPEEKYRCINAAGTAAFATCVTSSRINNHGRCQVMYFSKEMNQ